MEVSVLHRGRQDLVLYPRVYMCGWCVLPVSPLLRRSAGSSSLLWDMFTTLQQGESVYWNHPSEESHSHSSVQEWDHRMVYTACAGRGDVKVNKGTHNMWCTFHSHLVTNSLPIYDLRFRLQVISVEWIVQYLGSFGMSIALDLGMRQVRS